MGLILHIDTAVDTASVALARDGQLLDAGIHDIRNDHAAWLHEATRQLLIRTGNQPASLDAVAVSIGPGSYTGLRIGLAAAKGFCYALQIPLITIGTLEIMAGAMLARLQEEQPVTDVLLCPMIDARRMEAYIALYDHRLAAVVEPSAVIADETFFLPWLEKYRIFFFGNGSPKLREKLVHEQAVFTDAVRSGAGDMILPAAKMFEQKNFANLAYAEPLYIKEFYSPRRS